MLFAKFDGNMLTILKLALKIFGLLFFWTRCTKVTEAKIVCTRSSQKYFICCFLCHFCRCLVLNSTWRMKLWCSSKPSHLLCVSDLCGTPGYLAPELLRVNMYEKAPGYGRPVDM